MTEQRRYTATARCERVNGVLALTTRIDTLPKPNGLSFEITDENAVRLAAQLQEHAETEQEAA